MLTFNQCVLLAYHVIVAWRESNHSTTGPGETDPKTAFQRSSYTVGMLISFAACLHSKEKLILFTNKRGNAVVFSFESFTTKFSSAKYGHATVFVICYLTSFNFCGRCNLICIEVALI